VSSRRSLGDCLAQPVGASMVAMQPARTLPAIFLVLAACGGAQTAPGAAPAGSAAGESSTASAARPDRPRGPACTEGSCFACGEGVCLPGSYCETDKGKQGCAWSPKCASKSSCACLAPMLKAEASCRCEEKQGGVYVTCD
jgi:hypothetical protein